MTQSSTSRRQLVKRVDQVHPAPVLSENDDKHHPIFNAVTYMSNKPSPDFKPIKLPFETNNDRWDRLKSTFSTFSKYVLEDVHDLHWAIQQYNEDLVKSRAELWTFESLINLLDKKWVKSRSGVFFKYTLPFIIKLVLETGKILNVPVPQVSTNSGLKITISQYQVACIMANSFLCTWENRFYQQGNNCVQDGEKMSLFGHFNFNCLFSVSKKEDPAFVDVVTNKLICIIQYLEVTRQRFETGFDFGNLSIVRKNYSDDTNWDLDEILIKQNSDRINEIQNIEVLQQVFDKNDTVIFLPVDQKTGKINPLNHEIDVGKIKMTLNPELLACVLFEENLLDDEFLLVTGAEQFCSHKVSDGKFVYSGEHVENPLNRDPLKRLQSQQVLFARDLVTCWVMKKQNCRNRKNVSIVKIAKQSQHNRKKTLKKISKLMETNMQSTLTPEFESQPIVIVPQLHPAANLHEKIYEAGVHYNLTERKGEPCMDNWDSNHVRMPCSPKSLYPINKERDLEKRWTLIMNSLNREINDFQDLKQAVLKYNSAFKKRRGWNFEGLEALLETEGSDRDGENHHEFQNTENTKKSAYSEYSNQFFSSTLPFILNLVKNTSEILNTPIPLAKSQSPITVTLSQYQCACILANSFLCTWSRRNKTTPGHEYENFPFINFNCLFSVNEPWVKNKLKCLIHYFERVKSRVDKKFKFGNVTFQRKKLDQEDLDKNWSKMDADFDKSITGDVEAFVLGNSEPIEDYPNSLQADFANKFLGGGVLNSGCVQEEIRFMVCPELIVGMLFQEKMTNNESILITGAEQYSEYSGYSNTFTFAGAHYDKLNRDLGQRLQIQITAIDAVDMYELRKTNEQFSRQIVLREVNKVYCGIKSEKKTASVEKLPGFATGNWGCGAFGGTPHLKFLQQLMACSKAGRDMTYCCFDSPELQVELEWMYSSLVIS